jgi:uncharacterized protein
LAPKKISANEVLVDIRAGMSSEEIGKKYEISAKGTQFLFDKLQSANLLTQEEYQRLSASSRPLADLTGDNGGGAAQPRRPTEPTESLFAKTQLITRFEDDDKIAHVPSERGSEPVDPVVQPSSIEQEPQDSTAPAPMEFLDLAKRGKNQWWRYVVSILFMLVFPTAVAGIFIKLAGWQVDRTTGQLVGLDPFLDYIVLNLSMVLLLVCLVLAVRLEHKRPLFSLITPNWSIDWKKFGKSFGVFFGLVAFGTVVEYVLHPAAFQFNPNASRVLMFAPVVLILTPIQTTTEELLFRGYLLQMTGLLTRNRGVLVVISGALFVLPHLANPELEAGFLTVSLYYFACGCFLTLVTLKSNGLEMAMGIHAAINLFVALIVNYSKSALKSESIFFSTEIDPVFSLISFCVGAIVFYLIMFSGKISIRRPRAISSRAE